MKKWLEDKVRKSEGSHVAPLIHVQQGVTNLARTVTIPWAFFEPLGETVLVAWKEAGNVKILPVGVSLVPIRITLECGL